MSKGILYLTWGDVDELTERSITSVKRWHPNLPIHHERLPEGATLLDKARMYDLSPFDETLFLDADTVVMGDLSFGFQKAHKHGIACCICECPWARRFTGLRSHGDIVEYNTGVIFFNKSGAVQAAFELWKEYAKSLNSSLPFVGPQGLAVMPLNDQASFALAMEEWALTPFVLPLNWNVRPTWHRSLFGPIKIYHERAALDPSLTEWTKRQSNPEQVIQFAELKRRDA